MVICSKEPNDIKRGWVGDNDIFELKSCNGTIDSDCKSVQPWAKYQQQLWLLFHKDSNYVNNYSNISYVNCFDVAYAMNMCNPLMGNPIDGIVGDDTSYETPFNSEITSSGSQKYRGKAMNLQNHEYYFTDYDIHYKNVDYMEPHSVRQPHKGIHKVTNNIIESPLQPYDCSTRWCTVKFMDRYWSSTDVNTTLAFISDDEKLQKFCYWNEKNNGSEITIMECRGEVWGFLQVSHTAKILINFQELYQSNPRSAFEDFVKDSNSRKLGFQSYREYMCHLIDVMIEQIDENITNDVVNRQNVMGSVESTVVRRHIPPSHTWYQLDTFSDTVVRDFHDPSKTRGFLAHTSMDFKFIGPSRSPHQHHS